MSFRLAQDGGDKLQVTANSGLWSLTGETLLLDGNVQITTPNGEKITSRRAIFSPEFEGVYAPYGYATTVEHIEERASLEELERLLFSKYLKRFPPHLRAIFGALVRDGS